MENALGEDLPIGVYHTDDKIKNLKIKIKVRKIANACFTEKDSLAFGDSNEIELVNLMKASTASTERIFCWQEKVEKTEEVLDSSRRGTSGGAKKDTLTICLFTYIDAEILSSEWMDKTSCTYPCSKPSHLEQKIIKVKPKPRLHFPDSVSGQKPLFSNFKRIVKERSSTKETPVLVGQSMIIMSALFFEDSSNMEEIELCSLQVDDHGTLTVIPDFSKRKTYTFVNSRSETFEYEIENVSSTPKMSSIQREKYLLKKITLYKKKLKEEAIEHEFTEPPPDTVHFSLNCEIVSAQNFEASDIFIHYLFILPKGWNSESSLEGVTETCRCKSIDAIRVAYYGYICSLDLDTDTERKEQSIKVIFEATSVDNWGNFRNEGYGYADALLVPGTAVYDVYTWKIEPRTLRHKLQNFFIGGMPHLEDLSYIVDPKETKESQLSKYGLQTISSGKITFKTLIIQQNS